MRAMTNENFVFKYGNKGESNSFILLLINLRHMKGRGLFLIGTLLLLSEVLFGQDRISVTG